MHNGLALLTDMIEKEPGWLMGPVDSFMGFILNFIFNGAHALVGPGSLGLTIIVFTVLVRMTLVPSGIKMQKSTLVVKKLQPEIQKIKDKYGASKDPEVQRKIQTETQALYAKHKYNPLSGCLPLLVTLPIFMALNFLLRQPFMFVDRIGVVYQNLAMAVMSADNYKDVVVPIISAHVPGNMQLDTMLVQDVVKAINKFSPAQWDTVLTQLSEPARSTVAAIYSQKTGMESFLGLNLLSNAGWAFPGVLVPIISALTQFLSAFYGYKVNPPQDPQGKQTQMIMMIVMPLFMGYITVTITLGVGVYWVMGNIFMFVQQVIITNLVLKKEMRKEVATA